MRISDWSSDGCSADLTLITGYVDELVVDTAIRLFVVADIPAGLANNAVAGVTLRATAREGGGIGVQGTAITETTGANTAGKDTVFADITVGVAGDAARDGSHSDNDDYTVQTATLAVTKTSRRSEEHTSELQSLMRISYAVFCL